MNANVLVLLDGDSQHDPADVEALAEPILNGNADMVVGCLKARTVPVNVNYNYTAREVRELLDYVRPRAVIYHKSLGAKFADVLPPDSADLLLSVDDAMEKIIIAARIDVEIAERRGDEGALSR